MFSFLLGIFLRVALLGHQDSVFSFIRNGQTALQMAVPFCAPNSQCESSSGSTFSPTFGNIDPTRVSGCGEQLIVGGICIFLMTLVSKHLLVCLLTIGRVALVKYLFKSIFYWIVSLAIIGLWAVFIYSVCRFYVRYMLQIFFPVCDLPFCFLNLLMSKRFS